MATHLMGGGSEGVPGEGGGGGGDVEKKLRNLKKVGAFASCINSLCWCVLNEVLYTLSAETEADRAVEATAGRGGNSGAKPGSVWHRMCVVTLLCVSLQLEKMKTEDSILAEIEVRTCLKIASSIIDI